MSMVRICLLFIGLVGCSSSNEQLYFESLDNGWHQKTSISFSFENPNQSNAVDLFLYIRNNESYPFANIHLIAELKDPMGTITTDTLSYRMADTDGQWLGKGMLSKESKLWYKEGVSLPYIGTYFLSVRPAMRYNENIEPMEVLPGITAVGVGVEKVK